MQRTILLLLGATLAVGLFIVAMRTTSGQNAWVCNNGQLVEIGDAWLPKPSYSCPEITPTPISADEKK